MPTNHAQTQAPVLSRVDLVDAARSWSYYMDELVWCAERGSVTGSEVPEVPLPAVLEGPRDAV
jgi:hypothetical protein